MIDAYDKQIEKIERKVERKVLEWLRAQRLLAIPSIVAEVGETGRFDMDKQLVSHAGFDPVIHSLVTKSPWEHQQRGLSAVAPGSRP